MVKELHNFNSPEPQRKRNETGKYVNLIMRSTAIGSLTLTVGEERALRTLAVEAVDELVTRATVLTWPAGTLEDV